MGNQNLRDNSGIRNERVDLNVSVTDNFLAISYTKTSKLITALYMVTDIIDRSEPIRTKLRHLGAEIISDIHYLPTNACNKIAETVSFLNIASAMNLISEMNSSILKKEFMELNQSIKECSQTKPSWLEEFMSKTHPTLEAPAPTKRFVEISKGQPIKQGSYNGHIKRTRIGVQKGSTLMQALSEKTNFLSNKNSPTGNDFYSLKKERRNTIEKVIKLIGGNATIKDIKDKIQSMPEGAGSIVSFSEKTLQRELISMLKDGVLNKTGEKRWSRYSLQTATS